MLKAVRALILAYALLSAALYCCLMPLWEGFDELFHYGYVQHVSTHWTFPVIGKTMLSRELWTSLDYLPVSHYIQPYLGRPSISFAEYFRLTDAQRAELRRGADSIHPALRDQPSPRQNYEAQQTPLTYFLLAPVNAALSGSPLITRVLALRLALSLTTITLLWIGARRFCQRLGLPASIEAACLLTAFSCQMLYAETCRVGNDALTAPWLLFFLVAAMDAFQQPTLRRTAWLAFLMSLGLLIKASLLAFLPVALVTVFIASARNGIMLTGIVAALAGPWYARNLLLYRSFSANVDATSGVGPTQIFHAAAALPWARSLAYTAHSALWTGNNSFTTFSGSTLNVVLALLGIALALYCVRARRTSTELIPVSAILLYAASLVFITLAFFHSTRGLIIGPMPWYMQVLLIPILALAYLGLARSGKWGRWIAMMTVSLWAYVSAASWLAKLLPLYAGLTLPQAHPKRLFAWYLENGGGRDALLSNLCPAPAPVIYLLLAAVLASLVLAAGGLSWSHIKMKRSPPDHI